MPASPRVAPSSNPMTDASRPWTAAHCSSSPLGVVEVAVRPVGLEQLSELVDEPLQHRLEIELAAQDLGGAQKRGLLPETLAVLREQAAETNREPALGGHGLEQGELTLTPGARLVAVHRKDADRPPLREDRSGGDGSRAERAQVLEIAENRFRRPPGRPGCRRSRRSGPSRAARFDTGRFCASSPSGWTPSAVHCAATWSSASATPSRTKHRAAPSARPTSSTTVASDASRSSSARRRRPIDASSRSRCSASPRAIAARVRSSAIVASEASVCITARSSAEKARWSSIVATEITAMTRSSLTSGTKAALFAPVSVASRELTRVDPLTS